MYKRTLKFYNNGEDLGEAYTDLPLNKNLYPGKYFFTPKINFILF